MAILAIKRALNICVMGRFNLGIVNCLNKKDVCFGGWLYLVLWGACSVQLTRH
jgi:hypothetical protein